jgi:hypothetical protein
MTTFISPQELLERIERLLLLFPNEVHWLSRVYMNSVLWQELPPLLKEKGILHRLDHALFIYPGSHMVEYHHSEEPLTRDCSQVICYEEEVFQYPLPQDYLLSTAKRLYFPISGTIMDEALSDLLIDEYKVPKLFADVLLALYGKSWPKFITLQKEIKTKVPLLPPLYEKL